MERIDSLDIIRGFSLLGIFLSNIFWLSGYLCVHSYAPASQPDLTSSIIIFTKALLIDSKFYSLFSMLFGMSFGVQMLRASQKSSNSFTFTRLYMTRIFGLLIFGILHSLLWTGDILVLYALIGFFLLPLKNASNKTILSLMIISAFFPILISSLSQTLLGAPHPFQDVVSAETYANIVNLKRSLYARGNFSDASYINFMGLKLRWHTLIVMHRPFRVFSMFLLGYFIVKNSLLENTPNNRKLIKHVAIATGIVGIIFSFFHSYMLSNTGNIIANEMIQLVAVPTLAIAYASIIHLAVYPSTNITKYLYGLAPAGRMALTNYILQTVICVLFFRGYGLGFFNQLSAAECLAFVFVTFAFQCIVSYYWLTFYLYGPLEWLWRSFTYMTLVQFRKMNN